MARKAKSAAQIAAAKRNLAKARAARKSAASAPAKAAANHFPGADKMGLSSIAIRHGEKQAATSRPIRQYTSRQKPFEEDKKGAQSLRRKYVKFLKGGKAAAIGRKVK